MSADHNALGSFLRARRELVAPEQVGIDVQARRRVAGLRREEISVLAGISLDYYVRLERGRDRRPSPAVVEALARALRLDERLTDHLRTLAACGPAAKSGRDGDEAASPRLQRLLAGWEHQPALVLGRRLDVLAANALAEFLHPGFVTGTNLARFVFLDGRARERYGDWEAAAIDTTATLRGSAGDDLEDPELVALVEELSSASEHFRSLWARQDVRDKTSGTKQFRHPIAGLLSLDFDGFSVTDAPGQTLVVYSARPDTPDDDALKLLAKASLGLAPDATSPTS